MIKSKIILLIAIFLMEFIGISGCAGKRYAKDSFPGWTWIGGNNDGEMLYMDKTNLKKSDGNIMAWYTMTVGSGDYMTYYLLIDCSSDKYKGLSATHYDENNNVKATMGETGWDYAANGTAYYVMMREACK